MSDRVAPAISAHPDDIEFYMAGTMLLLSEAGYELHYPRGRIAFRMQRRPQNCRPLISSTKVTSLNFLQKQA
jgi:hypothetical protein